MSQVADGMGGFSLEGMNYGLPHQGLPICFLGVLHFKNPLVILDLILP